MKLDKWSFSGKDQDYISESTTYWFNIDGVEYGVIESPNESIIVVDDLGVKVSDEFSKLFENAVTDEMRMS